MTCELDITLVPGQKFLEEYLARIMESQELRPKCYTNYWEAGPGVAAGAVGPAARGADSAGSQPSNGEHVRSGAGGGEAALRQWAAVVGRPDGLLVAWALNKTHQAALMLNLSLSTTHSPRRSARTDVRGYGL